MAELIHLRDFQAARERANRRASDHHSVERALALMRENLAAAAERLQSAAPAEQPELLDRIEKLAAMIRYGWLMMGESEPGPTGNSNRSV
ncbi:MAG TPA: hypothetical protein VJN94_12895 [Candidatus Binataceae bacterium]|nr:hypothetical protein [Candidatus Binataceae bacterium]